MDKEKVQFTLTFYFKQSKAVQLDLQRFEIFTYSSLLQGLPPWENVRTKVTLRGVLAIWNMRATLLIKLIMKIKFGRKGHSSQSHHFSFIPITNQFLWCGNLKFLTFS